jgi:hypothetical protein
MENTGLYGIQIKNNKKIRKLFVTSSMYFAIIMVFAILFIILLEFCLKAKSSFQQQLNLLTKQNATVTHQIYDIANKTIVTQNYIKIWKEEFSEEQRELKGLNTSNIYQKILNISKHSKLGNVTIDFSQLILAGGSLEKDSMKVFTTEVTIKFSTITDIDVLNFLENLKKNIGCFIVVQEVNLNRTKKIDSYFIKTLDSGNLITAIDGIIKVRLYGLELK